MLALEPVIKIIKINRTLHLQLFKYPTSDTFKWGVQVAGSGFIPLAYNSFIWHQENNIVTSPRKCFVLEPRFGQLLSAFLQ